MSDIIPILTEAENNPQVDDHQSYDGRSSSTRNAVFLKNSHNHQEEVMGSVSCPSCRGTGRIPKELEKQLVALIPIDDKRLKPRRTWMWVLAAIFICLVLCGLVLFFLVPRTINLDSDDPAIVTVAVVDYEKQTRLVLNFMNTVNVSNDNFFAIQIVNATSSVIRVEFPSKSQVIGRGVMVGGILNAPMRSSSVGLRLNHTVTMSDIPLTICELFGSIRLFFQFTVTFEYFNHREQDTLETSQLVCCGTAGNCTSAYSRTMAHPVPFHRITVYESTNRFYIVGSDMDEKRFCLLKIDRSENRELVFSNGDHEYTKKELNELLAMIHGGNASSAKTGSATYVLNERVALAKGLLGFVRFLEGYYMIVITKASRVAQLGFHSIYKVEETEMIYIPSKTDSQQNAEEQRYLKLFQSVDLATNFYFSYTYDLTRTLQANIAARDKNGFCEKYVWNSYLIEPMLENRVNARWIVPITHGFIGTCSISIKGFMFNLLLLARRSNKYAGTRFLKRGANNRGYVANEVETEQIVYDSTVSSFERGRYTSFVQLRGSVPLIWSQDLTKVVGKPPIQLDLVDPFAVVPALHFQDLRARYGDPITVINLVKRRERRNPESVLNDEFRQSISYLNQFLDPKECILYLSFDMARCHKTGNVLPKLEEIGYNVLKLNGWFQTFPSLHSHQIRPVTDIDELERSRLEANTRGRFVLQCGVPRTNCVDCLDRTNVAQFVIGKVALAYQLYALGLLNEPRLGLETEISRILETLYEQHGDTLALQYAGSQLVHSIRTYKKISIFQERSRDVIQTLSRYYSNTFSDYDKQNAINLFLGIFRPSALKDHLWDLFSDSVLHNPFQNYDFAEIDYCAWFELPEDYWKTRMIDCDWKGATEDSEQYKTDDDEMRLSDFDRYYRTFEMTSLDPLVMKEQREMVCIDSASSPPTLSTQPFLRLWKKQETIDFKARRGRSRDGKRGSHKHKTAKNACDDEDDQEETSSEEETPARSDTEIQYSTPWCETGSNGPSDQDFQTAKTRYDASVNFKQFGNKLSTIYGKTMKEVYGIDIGYPSMKDMLKYERYVELGNAHQEDEESEVNDGKSTSVLDQSDRNKRDIFQFLMTDPQQSTWDNGLFENSTKSFRYDTLHPLSMFTNDSSFGVETPTVSEPSRQKYENSVRCTLEGPKFPSQIDLKIYAEYAQNYNSVIRGLRK